MIGFKCFNIIAQYYVKNTYQFFFSSNRSISFTSRKYAKLRKDSVAPGEYTLLILPSQDISGITINVSILPTAHIGAGNALWRPPPAEKHTTIP